MFHMSLDRMTSYSKLRNTEETLPRTDGAARRNTTLTRADLSDAVTRRFGSANAESRLIVEEMLAEIGAALVRSEDVKLSGFGSFNLCSKRARPGRNPKTGVEATISERKVLAFKPSQILRDQVNAR
jgi:integration host factor subunit alpha